MTLGAAIYTELKNNAGVSALVSTRIYPVIAPAVDENSALASLLAFRLRERTHEYAMDRKVYAVYEWEFVAAASSYDSAHEIIEAVITALDRFSGTLGGVGGVLVKTIQLVSSQDIDNDAELGIYEVGAVFNIIV